jgi:hypothetical protein
MTAVLILASFFTGMTVGVLLCTCALVRSYRKFKESLK